MANANYNLLREALMGMGYGLTQAVAMASESLGLDEKAREALAGLTASQQMAVIEDINPEACRNPSAVAIKKITQIKSSGGMGGMGRMGGMGDFGSMGGKGSKMSGGGRRDRSRSRERWGGLERTADSLGLDEKAREALAGLSESQQKAILEDINPEACRNPSAVAIKKIRGMGISPYTAMGSDMLGLDEKAREALAGLTESQQKAVIEDINPEACRNPSAVAIKKIMEIKSSGGVTGMGGMGGMGRIGGVTGSGRKMSGGSRNKLSGEASRIADALGLDENAREALAGLSESQQKAVLEDINPEVCRNPSAVAIKKIRAIESPETMGITLESEAIADSLGVDERAKEVLGTLTNIQQQLVLKSINPIECRNPSAMVIKKITEMRQRRNLGYDTTLEISNPSVMVNKKIQDIKPTRYGHQEDHTGYGMAPETAIASEILSLDEKAREVLAGLPEWQQKSVLKSLLAKRILQKL